MPLIDGQRLDERIGEAGWQGLWGVEATAAARLIQGWHPADLGLERAESRPVGAPIGRGPDGWVAYPVEPITEVEASRVDFDHFAGVPIMGCGCGGGIGCAALEVEVSFARDRVLWRVGEHRFEFTVGRYAAAVRDYLRLVGEAPVLISDEEWTAPTPTRVVPARPYHS